MEGDMQQLDLNWWRCDHMVSILNLYIPLLRQPKQNCHHFLLLSTQRVVYETQSVISPSSLLQWWTQRARRHHLNQRSEDLISDWCQCRHQEGRHLESSCAPWKWGRHPHGYPHGDRPLTLHKSQYRSWSYVLLITSGPYIGGGGLLLTHPLPVAKGQWCHTSRKNLALPWKERPCRCSKSSAVLCLPCVFSLLVFNALINETTVWSQT